MDITERTECTHPTRQRHTAGSPLKPRLRRGGDSGATGTVAASGPLTFSHQTLAVRPETASFRGFGGAWRALRGRLAECGSTTRPERTGS